VKLTEGAADVLFGHATWDDYQSLGPRTVKRYSMPRPTLSGNGSLSLTFSSSPGLLSSVDDFHLVRRRGHSRGDTEGVMAVMETTLDVYDASLLALIRPESILSWVRVRVANELAGDSPPGPLPPSAQVCL
jgi:hypothetical protein